MARTLRSILPEGNRREEILADVERNMNVLSYKYKLQKRGSSDSPWQDVGNTNSNKFWCVDAEGYEGMSSEELPFDSDIPRPNSSDNQRLVRVDDSQDNVSCVSRYDIGGYGHLCSPEIAHKGGTLYKC